MHKDTQAISTRLLELLDFLELTPYKASKIMGYSSPNILYNVINGRNGLSYELLYNLKKITTKAINEEWLKKGIGEMFLKQIENADYGNEFVKENKIFYPISLDLNSIKYIANSIFECHYDELEKFKADVSPYLLFGIQIHIHPKKSRHGLLVSISPSWHIDNSLDYWMSNGIVPRCEKTKTEIILKRTNNAIFNTVSKILTKKYKLDSYLTFNHAETKPIF